MIGKILKKIIERLLSMFCVLKKEQIYPAYVFKNIPQILKTRFSFNDSKWRRIGLSWSKCFISMIKKKDVKTALEFLLPQLPSYFGNRKKLESSKKNYKIVISSEENKTLDIYKNIFACLFGIHNTINSLRHEQACLLLIVILKH